MELKLTKPLIVFDLETTGLNRLKDHIVELAYIKIFPSGEVCDHRYLFNPGVKISPEAVEVHHITDEMVKNCPPFYALAPAIAADFGDSDIAGYNSDYFDVPMLIEEFLRAGVDPAFLKKAQRIDVQKIFFRKEPRTLEAALKFYCGKEHDTAHSALGDVRATYDVLLGQLSRYPDLENNVDFLAEYTAQDKKFVDSTGRMIYNDKGEIVFSFGKYEGRRADDVLINCPGYYDWIMKSDFPADFKNELTKLKLSLRCK